MYVGKDFDQANVGETDAYSFDFSARHAPGETLTAASWVVAGLTLVGGATFTAGGLTTQMITTGSAGNFDAIATATTSASRTLILNAKIPVVAP